MEFYGWAIPVVGNRKYQFRFGSGIDWSGVTIRYSEPDYLDPSEWLYLYSNYSTYRYQYRSQYNSVVRVCCDDVSNSNLACPNVPRVDTVVARWKFVWCASRGCTCWHAGVGRDGLT